MTELSVIVPVFNAERYLTECVDSILEQEFSDYELILVDDGSSDRSAEICDEYAKRDSRVKVIHQQNRGVAAARNRGLDEASGKYIAFVDSDDYIEKSMYQSMMTVAYNQKCDFVMCDCVKEYPDKIVPYTHEIRPGYYDKKQLITEYYPHLLMMENIEYPPTISNWLCVFQKKLCDGIRYLEGVRFSEDLLFGAQVIQRANSFFYMKDHLYYHYRMNPESATHTFASDKWEDYLRLFHEAQKSFANSEEFDFTQQIDYMLLFFVYNAVGDILKVCQYNKRQKMEMINEILADPVVRDMFHRVKVHKLSISWKLKIQTWIYKYRLGIRLLIP